MNKLIVTLLLIPTLVFADTDPSFQNKGYTLTQDAWIFSPEKTKEVRDKIIDLHYAEKNVESLKKSLTLQQEIYIIEQDKTKLLLERNDALAKSLNETRSMSDLQKFGWFALGVIGTVLTIYAVRK